MADLSVIRAAMASQISANTKPVITCLPKPTDAVNVPCAFIVPARNIGKYGVTLGGAVQVNGQLLAVTEFNLDIIVLVARADTVQNVQANVDVWIGAENSGGVVSIPMAIALDDSLGRAVEYCEPMSVDSYGPIEWNGVMYWGARIHTIVSAR